MTALFAFIVAIGVLVTVHELGHFWVARALGVKVLRFSVGFGKPLWSWRDRSGTEYVIAALPLGGYVKMLGEGSGEPVSDEERHLSFEVQPLSSRVAIVAAGPLFNFLFAIVAFSMVQMIGVSGMKPIIGEVNAGSVAAAAEVRQGDEILSVNGQPVENWQQALEEILSSVILGDSLELQVADPDGVIHLRQLENPFGADIPQGRALLDGLGFTIDRPQVAPRIGEVVSGGAAEQAGLVQGDLILTVAGEPVETWEQWVQWVRESPAQPLEITIERDQVIFPLRLTPAVVDEGEQTIGRIGATVDLSEYRTTYYRVVQYGPLQALIRGAEKSWQMSSMTLQVIGRMVVGATSTDGLSGPISIARYAGSSMESGVVTFLSFLGLVSISLGVLNLLPVPILDGGHLFYYLLEWVKGGPLSEQAMIIGQRIGIVFLVGLMSLALYNDILQLL